MKKLILIALIVLGMMGANAQTFESTKTGDTTVYVDDFGFEIGREVETTDYLGNVNTSYQDEFGFEIGTSTGKYNYLGEYEVDYDFNNYGQPQLNLSLPSLEITLPVLYEYKPDN